MNFARTRFVVLGFFCLTTSLASQAADEAPPTPPNDMSAATPAQVLAAAAPNGYDEFDVSALSMTDETGVSGDMVNPFTGELIIRAVDLKVPGNGGFDLQITRVFRSQSGNLSENYGYRWQFHLGRVGGGSGNCPDWNDSNVVFETPDGSFIKLMGNSSDSTLPRFISRERYKGACESGKFAIYSPSGIRYEMGARESDGYLHATKITDSNGNSMSITYTFGKLVQSITTSDGRIVNFSYDGSDQVLRSMTFNGNGTDGVWTYNYSRQTIDGRSVQVLAGVTNPVGLKTSYDYLAGSFKVTTPGGTASNYTFTTRNDMGLVVSKKVDSGGSVKTGTWSYAYALSSPNILTTTISGPSRSVSYKFDRGANGTAYMAGTLLEKSISAGGVVLETTTLTWGKQQVCETTFATDTIGSNGKVRITDVDTYAPILTKRVVNRPIGTKADTLTSNYSLYDQWGNPGKIVFSGVGTGASKTVSRTYENNQSKWILGLPLVDDIANAGTIERSYDGKGNLTSISNFGVTTSFEYTSEGDVSKKTATDGLQTSYSDFKRGIPGTIIYNSADTEPANQLKEDNTVNGYGLITSYVNKRRFRTSFTYDVGGRLIEKSFHNDGYTKEVITYPTATSQKITRDPSVGATYTKTTVFDGLGRKISETEGGITSTITYDAEGRVSKKSYPGATSGDTFTYNGLNLTTQVKHADGKTLKYAYKIGNLMEVTDENSKVTKYWYRSYGEFSSQMLLKVQNPIFTTEMTRDVLGNITKVQQYSSTLTDPPVVTRTYQYSTNKFLIKRTDPELGTTVFTVDSMGRVTKETLGSLEAINNTYDVFGRLIQKKTNEDTITYTYDGNDNLRTVANNAATRSMTYDILDQLVSESLTVGTTSGLKQTWTRNELGRIASVTSPAGVTDTFAPNTLGKPTRAGSFVSTVTYSASGQITKIDFANTKAISLGYDTRFRPNTYTISSNANMTITYDGRNNPTSIIDSAYPQRNLTLGYDGANRLNNFDGTWGDGGATYDAFDNLTSIKIGSNRSVTYDATTNRPTAFTGSASLAHNSRGNVSQIDSRTNTFDNMNRLTKSVVDNVTVTYAYDGLGKLVSRQEGTSKTIFFYNHANEIVGQYAADKTAKFEYLYLSGNLIGVRSGSNKLSLHPDIRGAILAVTAGDAVGTTLARATYTPQGKVIDLYGSVQTLTGNVVFQGLYQDPRTGYVNSGQRWYYPDFGRFLSSDPVGFEESEQHSFNRYAYAFNNSMTYWDPSGRFAFLLAAPLAPEIVMAVGTYLGAITVAIMVNHYVKVDDSEHDNDNRRYAYRVAYSHHEAIEMFNYGSMFPVNDLSEHGMGPVAALNNSFISLHMNPDEASYASTMKRLPMIRINLDMACRSATCVDATSVADYLANGLFSDQEKTDLDIADDTMLISEIPRGTYTIDTDTLPNWLSSPFR